VGYIPQKEELEVIQWVEILKNEGVEKSGKVEATDLIM